MKLADKLYEIIDDRYYKFCRKEGRPANPFYGLQLNRNNNKMVELIIKWHEILILNGMTTSTEFVHQLDLVCVKDPALLHNEWILVPNEIAMKIVVLGDLP